MVELSQTQATLARELKLSQPTLCQKINGIRPFRLDEAEILAELLKISDEDFGLYFFSR